MIRMEVRCCCQPQKLLGTLMVREEPQLGWWVKFIIPPRAFAVGRTGFAVEASIRVELPVAMYQEGPGRSHLALKSEETPIELLRRIPGFEEAKPETPHTCSV